MGVKGTYQAQSAAQMVVTIADDLTYLFQS